MINILSPIKESIYNIYKKSYKNLIDNTEEYLNQLRDLQEKIQEELIENNKNIFFYYSFIL